MTSAGTKRTFTGMHYRITEARGVFKGLAHGPPSAVDDGIIFAILLIFSARTSKSRHSLISSTSGEVLQIPYRGLCPWNPLGRLFFRPKTS